MVSESQGLGCVRGATRTRCACQLYALTENATRLIRSSDDAGSHGSRQKPASRAIVSDVRLSGSRATRGIRDTADRCDPVACRRVAPQLRLMLQLSPPSEGCVLYHPPPPE